MQDILKQVGTWLIIAMLGYVLANMQDRYTASTAEKDRLALIKLIESSENRVDRHLQLHVKGGPHDEVDSRLVAIEIRLNLLIDAVDKLADQANGEDR